MDDKIDINSLYPIIKNTKLLDSYLIYTADSKGNNHYVTRVEVGGLIDTSKNYLKAIFFNNKSEALEVAKYCNNANERGNYIVLRIKAIMMVIKSEVIE